MEIKNVTIMSRDCATEYGGKRLDHVDALPPIVAHMLKSALEMNGYRVTKKRAAKPGTGE